MTLRDTYAEQKIDPVPYDELAHFFYPGLAFSNSGKDASVESVREQFADLDSKGSRVWLLFGSNDGKEWTCLQVAQSKNNARTEVEEVIELIFRKDKASPKKLEFTNSAFYEEVCPKPTKGHGYRELLYQMIGKTYSHFRICFLKVDEYLGLKPAEQNGSDADRIVEICKNQYAEAKIARQTLAVYWRQYSAGVDGQAISYFAEHPKELE